MTIRFINQENEEITKLNTELIHVKFKGILSNTAEFPSVVLFLRLNWKIYSYVGNSTVFIYFSWRSLGICYGARCVHFIVLSGRRGTLFFLRAQIYRINSIFIKKTWTISDIYYYANVAAEFWIEKKTLRRNSAVWWCF